MTILTVFIVITLLGMKAFLLNFLVVVVLVVGVTGGVLLADIFHKFLGETLGGLCEISVYGGSPHGEIGWRSMCFALCLIIYLFIICSFIVCVSAFYLLLRSCLLVHASIMWFSAVGRVECGWLFL